VCARARPADAAKIRFASTAAIRAEVALAVPLYAGIEKLEKRGDSVQWGDETLYLEGRFATPDGKARFAPTSLRSRKPADGRFFVSTRRGKQFNSMVQRQVDPLTDAARHDVLMSPVDAGRLSLADGAGVRLVSDDGEFRGFVKVAPIKPGNLEVHWPEGLPLLSPTEIDPESREPDYNAVVRVERL
jgi:predicted molibdopterin-dependent oxidoreductase YjgC